jgi:CheY-like chemotaxis protein
MTKLLGTVVSKKASLQLDLKTAAIEGDATQIRQVIMNLITNASDALEGHVGTIHVRTGARHVDSASLRSPFFPDELPAQKYAYIEVEDEGCGISPENLTRIFDPFFTTKFTGRGLGLAAVLGIIRGHRGAINVKSTPGRGSSFEVLIPSSPATLEPDVESDSTKLLPQGQGLVLVIEDEPSVRSFVRQVLTTVGFEVIEAEDGRAGLAAFAGRHEEIAGVLLDLTMPCMDGAEVLRELKKIDPDKPVLIMSGYTEAEISTRQMDATASGFIQKPFPPRDLIASVCRVLGTKAEDAQETGSAYAT